MTGRQLIASGAIALTIAGVGYASKPAEIAPPRCAPVTEKVSRRWERNTSISQNPENDTYWTGSLPRFLGR